ncbi:hypothetical protein EV426DRAFT_582795 [Tirmania nivea]|nr:hypothetical protein EV426DRAFT_582795 [Tirmania nivea]
MVENLLGCEAVAETQFLNYIYSIVTNYLNWNFTRASMVILSKRRRRLLYRVE